MGVQICQVWEGFRDPGRFSFYQFMTVQLGGIMFCRYRARIIIKIASSVMLLAAGTLIRLTPSKDVLNRVHDHSQPRELMQWIVPAAMLFFDVLELVLVQCLQDGDAATMGYKMKRFARLFNDPIFLGMVMSCHVCCNSDLTYSAVSSQAPVVVSNVKALMEQKPATRIYDGYTACPVLLGDSKLMLAEFNGYTMEAIPTFKPKRYVFEHVYWHAMPNGRWYGKYMFWEPWEQHKKAEQVETKAAPTPSEHAALKAQLNVPSEGASQASSGSSAESLKPELLGVATPQIPGDVSLVGNLDAAVVAQLAPRYKGWLYLNPADAVLMASLALKGTANQTGFEMAKTSPLLDSWISAYDGVHPLLDVGCAYGRNVSAAVERLGARWAHADQEGLRVVACDCAQEHLDAVEELRLPGVKTVFGKLPDGFQHLQEMAAECGGFSGILISEVLHFLPGQGIEEAIAKLKGLLAPNGTLCITMFSPESNISGAECPFGQRMREVYAERQAAGDKWPGEGFDMVSILREQKAAVTLDEEAMKCFPSYFHVAYAHQLASALEDYGFKVLAAIEKLPRPLMLQCTSGNRAGAALLLAQAKALGHNRRDGLFGRTKGENRMLQCTSGNRAGAALLLAQAKALGHNRASASLLAEDLDLKFFTRCSECGPVRDWVLQQLPADNDEAQVSEVRNPGFVIEQLFDAHQEGIRISQRSGSSTFTYLVGCTQSQEAILIDPVLGLETRDLALADELGFKVTHVVNTHCHADHITSGGKIQQIHPEVKTVISAASGAKADVKVSDGDQITVGRYVLKCVATPGHTDGCMTFVLEGPGEPKAAFTGDTLLIRGCGRTDFQQGNASALYESVHQKIFSLPEDTKIYPGHDYNGRSLASEALTKDKDEFLTIMKELNLPYPRMMDEAVPANMVNGV
eukprot:g24537.t1